MYNGKARRTITLRKKISIWMKVSFNSIRKSFVKRVGVTFHQHRILVWVSYTIESLNYECY